MTLTPADVEQKTFSTALRGYELNEVDDFLDEVVATIKGLQDELADAKAKLAAGGAAVATAAVDESAVGRVLVAAQETADRLVSDAQSEAERILSEARAEAAAHEAEKAEQKAAVEVEMAELDALVTSVREKLALLATNVADRLDEMDAAIGSITGDADVAELDEADMVGSETEEVTDSTPGDEEPAAAEYAGVEEFSDEESEPESVEETNAEDEPAAGEPSYQASDDATDEDELV